MKFGYRQLVKIARVKSPHGSSTTVVGPSIDTPSTNIATFVTQVSKMQEKMFKMKEQMQTQLQIQSQPQMEQVQTQLQTQWRCK